MKALCWCDTHQLQVETVPDPHIVNPHDAIIKVTLSAICGSDLHLYNGWVPTLMKGDILGHEFMGEVVETGNEVKTLRAGDRVVVPFTISCGKCFFCQRGLFSQCDNTNPNAWIADKILGHSCAGFYGYSHAFGGYAGGQAQYVRVPFADVGPIKVPDSLPDEKVLFLSDIYPTGYMAAENANIQPGDVVAVWGCGPVGQFAIKTAWWFHPSKVIAIDRIPERLQLAREEGNAVTINYEESNTLEELKELTGGRGPDCCIDAVGMEAHSTGMEYRYDKAMQLMRMETDRPIVLRECIMACRKGGTVSLIGVYGGFSNMIPMGAAFNKALTFRMGQTHMQKYMRPLLERIEKNEIDPSFVISHRLRLDDAPHGYKIFNDKKDRCTKVVLQPFD
jgi:threonine dehydrogenase-like Zn-dependent dehydrogenase